MSTYSKKDVYESLLHEGGDEGADKPEHVDDDGRLTR
jgi:hypothetical protein